MALDIQIQRITKGANSAASTIHEQFKIQSQDFNVSYDRSPISAPMPGGAVLLFDLGQTRVNISMSGIAAETGTNITEGGIMIADKDDIEALAITQNWWNGIIRVVALGDEYQVVISSVKLALSAPVINRWTFNISMTGKLMEY
mgnify:CR=1 FL=1